MKFDIRIFFENLITRTLKLTLLLNVKPDGASINKQALNKLINFHASIIISLRVS